MASPSIGKKMQGFDYKIDMIANQMEHDNFSKGIQDGQEETDAYYDMQEYEYVKFRRSLSQHEEEHKLHRNEMEDLYDLNVEDLHNVLIKDPPKFIIKDYEDFYAKARTICENGFNLTEKECILYFMKFLIEFQHSQNRSIFIKRLLQVTLERLSDDDMKRTIKILKKLYVNELFTKQQLRRGLDRLYMDAENLRGDLPQFAYTISQLILSFVEDDILPRQVILRIPGDLREEMIQDKDFSDFFKDELEVFEKETEIKQSFEEVAASSEKDDAITRFTNLGHPDIVKPWFIGEVILSSCGKTHNEREAASQLLKQLSEAKEINYPMISYCFDELLQNHEDYTLDIPYFADYLSMFIARSIYDGNLNSMYILHAELFDQQDETQLQILKSAISYLTLFPLEIHVGKIWGSAISNAELCQRFDDIIEGIYSGTPASDLHLAIQDCDCPFYHHEFVKRLVLFQISQEGEAAQDYRKVKKFLEKSINIGILSKSQLEVGIKNAHLRVVRMSESDANITKNFENIVSECLNKLELAHD